MRTIYGGEKCHMLDRGETVEFEIQCGTRTITPQYTNGFACPCLDIHIQTPLPITYIKLRLLRAMALSVVMHGNQLIFVSFYRNHGTK